MAAQFGAANTDKIDLGAAGAALVDTAGAGTIAIWVNKNTSSGPREAVNLRYSGGEIELVDGNGNFGVNLRGSFGSKAVSTSSLSLNKWFHLALTWDKAADQFKFFLDGAQVGTTQTAIGSVTGTLTLFYIGNNNFSESWSGKLAEFGVWGTALGDAEIRLLAQGNPPPKVRPNLLKIYMPLQDGQWTDKASQLVGAPSGVKVTDHAPVLPFDTARMAVLI